MVATAGSTRLEGTAHDFFDVATQLCLAAPRGRRREGGLKEIEFHTLTILQERGAMIVGDIQRLLGVLPAQMSRVIRALEMRREPLIACRINPQDKRKIDVTLTEAGEKRLGEYQAVRVRRIAEMLHELSGEEQANLVHLLDRLQGLLERGAATGGE